jgi:hypothetical protein
MCLFLKPYALAVLFAVQRSFRAFHSRSEFRIRGVNKCHYDAAWPGIPKTHANTIRWGVPLWLSASVSSKLMQDSINAKIVPIAGVCFTAGTYADADNVTCKEDTAYLTTAVDQWVAQSATFRPFEKYVLINIANEWGPVNGTVWRDAYVTAVSRMRAAGYLGTLIVDAGGCGQDAPDVAKYAQAIFDSDPQPALGDFVARERPAHLSPAEPQRLNRSDGTADTARDSPILASLGNCPGKLRSLHPATPLSSRLDVRQIRRCSAPGGHLP